ncbi:hypothetical protein WA171_000235, partial [Blastocystis sp. BT1]
MVNVVFLIYTVISAIVYIRFRRLGTNETDVGFTYRSCTTEIDFFKIPLSIIQHSDLFPLIIDICSIGFITYRDMRLSSQQTYTSIFISLLFHGFLIASVYLMCNYIVYHYLESHDHPVTGIGFVAINYCVSSLLYTSLTSGEALCLFLLLLIQVAIYRKNVALILCSIVLGMTDPFVYLIFMSYWETVITLVLLVASCLNYLSSQSRSVLPTRDETNLVYDQYGHIDTTHAISF